MTIEEYQNKEEDEEGQFVIKVLHHKTSSSSGEADIVIDKDVDSIIQRYLGNIRGNVIPDDKTLADRLFLTQTSNE